MKRCMHRAAGDSEIQGLKLAKELIGKLYILIRNARTHDRNNSTMSSSARAAADVLERLLESNDFARFEVVSDCIFFNSVRLKPDVADFKTFGFFIEQMKTAHIRAIVINGGCEEEDLLGFAVVVAGIRENARDPAERPFKRLSRLLQLENVAGIRLEERQHDLEAFSQAASLAGSNKDEARHSFFSALHIVREAVKGGISNGSVNPRKVKRVVESVVDNILSDEESVLALTFIRDYDQYTYQHSLNVCVYSIALGNRLGLPKAALCEIGISALFHDIGKTDLPLTILNKTGELTDSEWRQIRRHTKTGVQVLTQFKKLDKVTLRAMVVAFCHHMNLDRTGYPETSRTISPDTASKIVRIADVYDALTGNRSYRVKPFPRSRVLEVIREKSGKELDPVLCAVFEEVVGVLPDPALPGKADRHTVTCPQRDCG
jgi:putative nucleotidyltransferase with HDIG domain